MKTTHGTGRLLVACVIADVLPDASSNPHAVLAYQGSSSDRRKAMRSDARLIRTCIRQHGFGTVAANGKTVAIRVSGHVVGMAARDPSLASRAHA